MRSIQPITGYYVNIGPPGEPESLLCYGPDCGEWSGKLVTFASGDQAFDVLDMVREEFPYARLRPAHSTPPNYRSSL